MDFKINYAKKNDAIKCNELLTKLIIDEKKYDENINEKCIVKSLYEKFYDHDDICLLVAKYENEVIGYLYGYIENNGDAKINKVSVLDAIYVEENYRNNKIAKSLINEFKNWSIKKNIKYIELKVCDNNIIANELYKNLNFKKIKSIMKIDLED